MFLSPSVAGSLLLSAFVAQDVAAFVPKPVQHHMGKQLPQPAPSSTSLFNEYIQTSVSPIQTIGGKNKNKKAPKIEASEIEGPSVYESYQPPEVEGKSEEPVPDVSELLEAESSTGGQVSPDIASEPASETAAPADEDAV